MIYIKDNIDYVCKHKPSKQAEKSRTDWGWYDNTPEVGGVLKRIDLLKEVQSHITNYTNTTEHYCLRSWWVVLNTGDCVPAHSHRYRNPDRIVSGVFYIEGDTEPLHILDGDKEHTIDNLKNRIVLFDGHLQHWTEPYTGTKTRYAISFDFRILKQPLCDCDESAICNKCVHTKFIDKGFTAYTGPVNNIGESGTMNKNQHIEIHHSGVKFNEGDMHDYKE